MDIITRQEALTQGSTRYRTGIPCKHGHLDERRTCDGYCVTCGIIQRRQRRARPGHKIKINDRKRLRLLNDSAHRERVNKQARDRYNPTPEFKARDKRAGKKWREKESCGVYLVYYKAGIYVGSGQITNRRVRHLNGHARIARKLGTKAIRFVVLGVVSKNLCTVIEQQVIDCLGINNLLNKKRAL